MSAIGIPQPKVLVVGLGNPDRGDDGVGAIVARNLPGRLPSDVEIRTRSGDMLSLVDEWAGFDAVICIDAAAPIGAPGRVHRIDLAAGTLPRDLALASSHAFGLGDAIELARALRLAPRHIIVYAVEGDCFDSGASMTPEVDAAAAEVAEQVIAEVGRLRRHRVERQTDA